MVCWNMRVDEVVDYFKVLSWNFYGGTVPWLRFKQGTSQIWSRNTVECTCGILLLDICKTVSELHLMLTEEKSIENQGLE
jgi:hypothetical protein